ncbi:MAG TPA: Lrp/AsnC family transcriptional regulator [Clostridiales bacterium]|nr:Lrp/AsnC family transcriptional regulator [Clostridiales bacterium]
MDHIDIKILDCLLTNARLAASVIGERVNLSVSAVIERIKKLENQGIIKQYTTILDSEKIGKGVTAFISVSLEHPKYNAGFIESVQKCSQITECHYITGDFDFLLKVVTQSTHSLEDTLNLIKSIKGISLTKTLVVFSTWKRDISVLPDEIQK